MFRFLLAFVCLLVMSVTSQAAGKKCSGGSRPNTSAFASSSYVVIEQAPAKVAPAPAPTAMPSGSYTPKAVPQRLPVGQSRIVTAQVSSQGSTGRVHQFFQRPIFHPFHRN